MCSYCKMGTSSSWGTEVFVSANLTSYHPRLESETLLV